MDPARWRRVQQVLQEVWDLPAEDREARLAAACAGDATLLDEVRGLLEPDAEAPALIEGIVADAVSGLLTTPVEGERVGPYRIVREIGQGGMGAVYLADRVDGQFEQRVALKLIKPGLSNEQFLRRFQTERQILARLQHPHIARLLDGGVDDRGRPYFALEYVEGEPIDRYSAARALSLDERLVLFLDVCRAVIYAHANLVVHRDLKPAHILVAGDGHVRLLDFGIAKVLSEEDAGPGLTQVGVRALTPEYASPEQVRGEAVGTGTDVYSLGVILYELLTGVRPYQIDSRSPADVERVVCESVPEKPSTRVGSTRGRTGAEAEPHGRPSSGDLARSRRRLRGDLDLICLKALQKDPARRYSSVDALMEDIRRNLAGLPVLARPDSVAYRLGKFAARHRVGVAMAAASVIAFGALVAYHTARLTSERDRAQVAATEAEQVATFLRDLFEVSDPSESKGRTITARELLDEGARRIERDLASQPEVRASMMLVMGDVYRNLGLYEDARPLLERALAEHRRLNGDQHEEVAESEVALATLLQDMGDVKSAEPLFRSALATRQRLFGERHPKVSESLANLAFLLETRGDAAGAEQMAREVLAMDRALFPANDPRVAKSLAELAGMLRRQQRYEEAEPLLREALRAQRAHYGDKDLTVASTIRNLASLLRDRGGLEEAEKLYAEALAIRREILGDAHPEVAIALNSYALLLDRRGDPVAATTAYREVIRIMQEIHQGRPHPDLAATYNNLAAALRVQGHVDEAAEAYRLSLQIVDQVLEAGHPNRAFARIGLAGVFMDQKRFAQAEPFIREALAIRRAGLPAGHRYIGDALISLGECLTGLRRFAEAERHLLEAHRLLLAAGGAEDDRTLRAVRRLDALYKAWSKPQQAARIGAGVARVP